MTTRMKLVPAKATAAMKAEARMKIPGGHGQAWIYAGEAVNAAIAAAPHDGKVSRKRLQAITYAVCEINCACKLNNLKGCSNVIYTAHAVITALGLEVDE